MSRIREPAVAGLFYPADPGQLARAVQRFIDEAEPTPWLTPKAIVVPHAGYAYSGPIAGTAYAAVRPLVDRIRRVVLLGPAHRVGFRGIATAGADQFVTPLGSVAVDWEAVTSILSLAEVHLFDQAFAGEHSLEVQLPFLQQVFPNFKLVPLLVGDARPEAVEAVLEKLWGGPETLVVISSALSHYHD
ncbi:MEMO1 family protein [uncultured Gammaproteobacteria bacterium]